MTAAVAIYHRDAADEALGRAYSRYCDAEQAYFLPRRNENASRRFTEARQDWISATNDYKTACANLVQAWKEGQ